MIRTLIVEDNSSFRRTLKELLLKKFPTMAIEEAADGKEALKKFNLFYPHLIIVDLHLPAVNGFEVTRSMKAERPETHSIILTSYDLPEYRRAAYESGADHFLSKHSSSWDDISSLVESVISEIVREAGGEP